MSYFAQGTVPPPSAAQVTGLEVTAPDAGLLLKHPHCSTPQPLAAWTVPHLKCG